MKIIRLLLAVFLITASAFASEPDVTIGTSFGSVFPLHFGTFNFYSPNNTDGFGNHRFSFGGGSGYQLGLTAVVALNQESKLALGINAGYSYNQASTDAPANDFKYRLLNGDTIISLSRFSHQYSQSSITTDFTLRYKPFDQQKFGVMGGLSVSYILNTRYDTRHELVFNPNAPGVTFLGLPSDSNNRINNFPPQFSDDTKTAIILYDGELPDVNPLQVSLSAGVFYDVYLTYVIISPSIAYNFPITKVASSQDWRLSQFVFLANLRFAL